MNAFKGGFVAMAKVARVPIQTVIVETDTPFLSKGWSVLRKPPRLPMRYRVRLGERFRIAPDADLAAAVEMLREHFVSELAGAQLGELWNPRAGDDVDQGSGTKPRAEPRHEAPHGLPSLNSSR